MKDRSKNKRLKYLRPLAPARVNDRDLQDGRLSGIIDELVGPAVRSLFMKRFSPEDFKRMFRDIGLREFLSSVGLEDIKIIARSDEYSINYLKVYNKDEKPDNLLMDMRVTESAFVPDETICGRGTFDGPLYMIVIEWLSLQNPYQNFNETRPQLPGQDRPGLGALKYCFRLMSTVGEELVRDGFMDIPDHMSGAVMYSKKFKFFDPRHEAILHAVIRDLKGYSLRDISWGMITETVIDEYKNAPQAYDPSEQIYPTSERMKKYFKSDRYTSVYKKYYKRKRYRFDYDRMVEKRQELLKKQGESEL